MVKYYNSGWYLDGDTLYHTEETCEDGKRVRAIQPQERTVQADMKLCETCARIGQDRQSKSRLALDHLPDAPKVPDGREGVARPSLARLYRLHALRA